MPRFRAKVSLPLIDRLNQIKDDMREVALTGGVQAGAEVIVNEAKINCPVDTGTLRRSIHYEITSETPTRVTASVGTDVEYAAAVEFGHMTRPAVKHPEEQLPGRPRFVAAQPFLRPAVDEHGQEAADEMLNAFGEFVLSELNNIGPRGGSH